MRAVRQQLFMWKPCHSRLTQEEGSDGQSRGMLRTGWGRYQWWQLHCLLFAFLVLIRLPGSKHLHMSKETHQGSRGLTPDKEQISLAWRSLTWPLRMQYAFWWHSYLYAGVSMELDCHKNKNEMPPHLLGPASWLRWQIVVRVMSLCDSTEQNSYYTWKM